MEYRKFGNRYMVRMDPGEEILTKVKELCKAENITLGEFRGLGAANELELGLYDVTKKQYFKEEYHGQYEITSLFGTISEKDGDVYLHAHLSAGTLHGVSLGGHLSRAVISGTCEMIVEPMERHAGRAVNELTGLNDLKFDS